MTGHIASMEEGKSSLKNVSSKPSGNRPVGRPGSELKDNIREDINWKGVNNSNWN